MLEFILVVVDVTYIILNVTNIKKKLLSVKV